MWNVHNGSMFEERYPMEFFSEGKGLAILGMLLGVGIVALNFAFRFSKRKNYTGQTIIPSLMVALSLLFLAITFGFPQEEAGPTLIPRLWIFWLILLSSAILTMCIRGKGKPDPKTGRIWFLMSGVALMFGYYICIIYLGYFISTFVFLAAMMYMLSCRKPLTIFLVCSGWMLFSYLIFYKLLYIQLPLGVLENFI